MKPVTDVTNLLQYGAMAIAYVQVRLPFRTLRATDVAINAWHFTDNGSVAGSITEGMRADIKNALQEFYNIPPEATDRLSGYLSSAIDRTACGLRIYRRVSPTEVQFLEEEALALSPWVTDPAHWPMPTEVAAVLTSVGLGPGPIRRRRGRTYLGPLQAVAFERTPGPERLPAFNTTFMSLVANCAERMAMRRFDDDIAWAVYSRTDNTATKVTQGWINNEADTQRRRSLGPTNRHYFGI